MKATSIILGTLLLLLLTQAAWSQQLTQIDTAHATLGWHEADTTGLCLNDASDGTLILTAAPTSDTIWLGLPLLQSFDRGLSWHRLSGSLRGRPLFVTADYGYVRAGGDTLFRTTNGGTEWDTLHTTLNQIWLACAPSPEIVYCAGSSWIGRSTDSGATWKITETGFGRISTVSFADPIHGFIVDAEQVTGPDFPWQYAGGCARTTDGGGTWHQIYTGQGTQHSTELFGVDAITSKLVLATGVGHVYRTTDGGDNWSDIASADSAAYVLGNPPVLTSVDTRDGTTIAVGSSGMIISSTDSGLSWTRQKTTTKNDLGSVKLLDRRSAIVTGANGTILITSDAGASWVKAQAPAATSISATPNPADETLTLSYTLAAPQRITIQVFASAGQLVTTAVDGLLQDPGVNAVVINTQAMPSGSYEFHIKGESIAQTGSFVVIH